MEYDTISYISKEEMPEFPRLEYEKEPEEIPSVGSEQGLDKVEKLIEAQGCVLLEDWKLEEAMKALMNKKTKKYTSKEAWINSLSPKRSSDLIKLKKSEGGELYITANQDSYSMLSGIKPEF